jgi:hypothetical protein
MHQYELMDHAGVVGPTGGRAMNLIEELTWVCWRAGWGRSTR